MTEHADAGGRPRRALVVDDATTVRLYHGQILRAADFEVDEAANGYEALEKILGARYDLLLVDVNMPQLDGYGLVRAVREEPHRLDCPIVMISTEDEDADAERAYQAGANLYLTKPVNAEQLALVADVLTGTTVTGP